MTTLKIDMAKFKETCRASRSHMAVYDCLSTDQHRMAVQWDCETDWTNAQKKEDKLFTADDMRASLGVASRAAQQHGATKPQIDYLVALAEKAGRVDSRTPNILTKFEASMMIKNLQEQL